MGNDAVFMGLKSIEAFCPLPDENAKKINTEVSYVFNEDGPYSGLIKVHLHLDNQDFKFSEFRQKAIAIANQVLRDAVIAIDKMDSV